MMLSTVIVSFVLMFNLIHSGSATVTTLTGLSAYGIDTKLTVMTYFRIKETMPIERLMQTIYQLVNQVSYSS